MKKISELKLHCKKVIIFDLDGTLIDSIGIWNIADCELIHMLSGAVIREEQVQYERDDFLAKNQSSDIYLDYCSYLQNKYGMPHSPEEILKFRWAISNKHLEQKLNYKEEADTTLNELKKMGFTLALATVTTQTQLEVYKTINRNIIEKAHLPAIFDLIIAKEDVSYKKPHPEIYLRVLQHFHIEASEALVFEDSLLGVQAAKNAGIEVVNVYDKYSDVDRSEIDKLSDYHIKNYAEALKIIRESSIRYPESINQRLLYKSNQKEYGSS